MLILINSNGELVKVHQQDIFQGSTKANEIILLAPFADSVTFKAVFELPDGSIKPDNLDGYILTPVMKIAENLNTWKLDVNFPVTQDFGVITLQIRGISGDTTICTTSIKIPVQKGVPYASDYEELPDKDQLLTLIADLRALLSNKTDKIHYEYEEAIVDETTQGLYYIFDGEEYAPKQLPQDYEIGQTYYSIKSIGKILNNDNGVTLEYEENAEKTTIKVEKDRVTINGKAIVVTDDLKAQNIEFNKEGTSLNADNVQDVIVEVNEKADTNKASIDIIKENYAKKSDLNNYYTKQEVYTKSETDDRIPKRVGQLINDSGFITRFVADLQNYYTKAQTYTKDEVLEIVQRYKKASFKVVDVLPEVGEDNIIYLVPRETPQGQNIYDEYVYIDNMWEKIGSTDIDLSNYYTRDEIDNKVGEINQDIETNRNNIETLSGGQTELAQRVTENENDIDYLDNKVRDIELFKFPNATIVGSPLISNGQVSEFTTEDYLQFPFIVDMQDRAFEIDFAFTTGNDVITQQNILDSQFGLALAISNAKGLMAISNNGTSWDIGSQAGTYTILPNTTYYAKLTWDKTRYVTSISTDGIDYVEDIVISSTLQPYPRTIFIGGSYGLFGTGTAHPFGGTINLNKATLKIANLLVWSGMDDAGLSTRADLSLSNIDSAGIEKITDIAKAYVDSLNAQEVEY